MTIRLNRVQWLMWIAAETDGRMLPRGMTGFREWAWKAGILQNAPTGWNVALTDKGRELLAKSVREHEAHGNFNPERRKESK